MKCSFCKKTIKAGTGKIFAKNDGSVYYWCSKKCEKNFGMGRDPKRVNWVIKSQKSTKKK